MSTSGKPIIVQYLPQRYQQEIHDSNKRYRVVIIGRRGGKTELAINECIMRAVTKPGLYWIVAPSYRQVKSIVWTRLKSLLKVDAAWKYNEQELYAEHPYIGTRIELRGADNEDSLRGVGLQGVILDECSTMKANVWPEVIRPMLADTGGWALFISTPKGRNWLYDLYLNKDNNWQSWQYGTEVNEYIKPEEIEEAKKDLSERLFRQEFLAEFLSDETGVFKRVRSCITGDTEPPKAGRFYVIGIDLAKAHDFTVLTAVDTVSRHVVEVERFQDISWKEQKLRIQEIARRYNNALCVIDSTGVGDPIYEDLSYSNISIEPFKFTNDSKCKLIENLAIAIEQRLITFPRIDHLVNELMDFEYAITPKGNITYQAPEGKHDDCVISLGLSIWSIRSQLKEAQSIKQDLDQYPQDRQGQGEKVEEDGDTQAYAGY